MTPPPSSCFAHPFLESAFGAGTAIAVVSGLVGYLVVLRGQVFAGDALSHVAFTGALAALAFGVDLRLGLYGGCVAFGLLLAVLGRQQGPDDTVIGSVFAWVLGLGRPVPQPVHHVVDAGSGGSGGTTGVSVLFGSILGLSGGQALGRRRGLVWPWWPRWWPSPGRWCSPASTRRWPARGACRCGRCRPGSSCCSG